MGSLLVYVTRTLTHTPCHYYLVLQIRQGISIINMVTLYTGWILANLRKLTCILHQRGDMISRLYHDIISTKHAE